MALAKLNRLVCETSDPQTRCLRKHLEVHLTSLLSFFLYVVLGPQRAVHENGMRVYHQSDVFLVFSVALRLFKQTNKTKPSSTPFFYSLDITYRKRKIHTVKIIQISEKPPKSACVCHSSLVTPQGGACELVLKDTHGVTEALAAQMDGMVLTKPLSTLRVKKRTHCTEIMLQLSEKSKVPGFLRFTYITFTVYTISSKSPCCCVASCDSFPR